MNEYWYIGWHAYELTCSWCYSSDDWVIIFICCCSVVSNSLQPHGLQHSSFSCPLPSPGAHTNSCPLSCWCHPSISSSVNPFSSCLPSFPLPGSFPMSRLFASGGQRNASLDCHFVRVPSLFHWSEMLHFSISPFNEHSRLISFRTDWFDLIAVHGTLKWMWKWKSLNHVQLYTPWNSPGQNIGVGSLSLLHGIFITQGSDPGLSHCGHQFFGAHPFLWSNSHILLDYWTHMTTGETIALTRRTLLVK